MNIPEDPVIFGLKAQGHIPTVERMLAEGETWAEIGKAIGWCPKTAERHYGWYKVRLTESICKIKTSTT